MQLSFFKVVFYIDGFLPKAHFLPFLFVTNSFNLYYYVFNITQLATFLAAKTEQHCHVVTAFGIGF
jgi:hypothetical protein